MDSVEAIQAANELERASIRLRAQAHIAAHGRVYSRELADPKWRSSSMRVVQAELQAMEREGLLTSELSLPCEGKGMARRYYRSLKGENP